jgi:hypothetical protein
MSVSACSAFSKEFVDKLGSAHAGIGIEEAYDSGYKCHLRQLSERPKTNVQENEIYKHDFKYRMRFQPRLVSHIAAPAEIKFGEICTVDTLNASSVRTT